MIWAIKNNEKILAEPKLKAFCPICKEELIAKCGEIKIWHWAHKSGNECDNWYEPESIWHINWKSEFPKEQQEVMIKKDNKYHIADIKTRTSLVIELQHSSISSKDVRERENFYEDMIWLLDGKTFGKNIILKRKYFQWKWIPSIIKLSKKNIFIDFHSFLIKVNKIWHWKNKYWGEFTKYSKKNFLNLYGDIYDIRNN